MKWHGDGGQILEWRRRRSILLQTVATSPRYRQLYHIFARHANIQVILQP